MFNVADHVDDKITRPCRRKERRRFGWNGWRKRGRRRRKGERVEGTKGKGLTKGKRERERERGRVLEHSKPNYINHFKVPQGLTYTSFVFEHLTRTVFCFVLFSQAN